MPKSFLGDQTSLFIYLLFLIKNHNNKVIFKQDRITSLIPKQVFKVQNHLVRQRNNIKQEQTT